MSAAPSRQEFLVRIPIRDETGRVVGETTAIRFVGLLHLAHEAGLTAIRTNVLELPSDANGQRTVVQATVETTKGTFTAIGDASPANVNRRIAPHAIRMAETRSIGRALRLAVDVGVVTVEELNGDGEDMAPVEPAPLVRPSPPRPTPVRARPRGRDNTPEVAARTDTRAMSPEQRRFLFRLAFALGETRESALARVQGALGADDIESATRCQAARAIDALKAELADHESERNAIQEMNGAGHA